jgi:hypothetical protein
MPLLETGWLAIPEVMYFRYRLFEDERGGLSTWRWGSPSTLCR